MCNNYVSVNFGYIQSKGLYREQECISKNAIVY